VLVYNNTLLKNLIVDKPGQRCGDVVDFSPRIMIMRAQLTNVSSPIAVLCRVKVSLAYGEKLTAIAII
jgi:hypothetical protein